MTYTNRWCQQCGDTVEESTNYAFCSRSCEDEHNKLEKSFKLGNTLEPVKPGAYSEGKPQLRRLIPFKKTLESVCRVLEHGEHHHEGGDSGWLTYDLEYDIDALGRHFLAGVEPDEDTKESHLIHIICRAMFAHEKWLSENG